MSESWNICSYNMVQRVLFQGLKGTTVCLLLLLNIKNSGFSAKVIVRDSLKKEFEYVGSDSGKIILARKLCDEYFNVAIDTFLYYLNYVENTSRKVLTDSSWLQMEKKEFFIDALVWSLSFKGYYFQRKEWDHKKALTYYNEAMQYDPYIRDSKIKAQILNNIANVYENLGDIQSAVRYYESAIKFCERLGDKQFLALTLDDLGLLQLQYGEIEKAEDYFQKSLLLLRSIHQIDYTPSPMMHLGYISALQNDFTQADHYIKAAYGIALGEKNKLHLALIHRYWGQILEYQGKLDSALHQYKKSILFAENINYYKGLSISHLLISKLYKKLNSNGEMVFHAEKSYDLACKANIVNNIKNAAEWLSEVYETKNDPVKALQFYKLKELIKDSLFNLANEKVLMHQQMKYEFEKKELVQEIQIRNAKNEKYISIALGIILIFFIVGMYNRLHIIRKANREIDFQRQKAEYSERVKTSLYTNITHEFRTPLTLILGLANRLYKENTNSNRQGIGKIIKHGQHMQHLVDQILDLSKLESNQMDIHMVQSNIVPYIQRLASNFQEFAESKDIRLEFIEVDPTIIMDFDPDKMQQIVYNLLSNAIKFTDPGGRVQLTMQSIQNEYNSGKIESNSGDKSKSLFLEVADTGIGIAKEELPNLFKKFYQSEGNIMSRNSGTGIGLSLVYELVKLLKGQIEVQSNLGRGTSFKLKFPIENSHQSVSHVLVNQLENKDFGVDADERDRYIETINENFESESNSLILVIEDNYEVREFIEEGLRSHYKVESASDGKSGLEKAFEIIPDLIVSDIMMPELDGLEMCKILKKDTRSSHIPIILLTAKSTTKDRLTGLTNGADAYIVKPFLEEELILQIGNLLRLKEGLKSKYLSLSEQYVPEDPDPEDQFILRLKGFIERHLGVSEISIENLCHYMGMSRMQLHRKIKALTGESTTHYIRHIKLEKARILLVQNQLNVSEIAYKVGFDDPRYFSRLYNEKYGISPSQEQGKALYS